MSSEHANGFLRFLVISLYSRAHSDEVQTVAVIHHRVDALRAACLEVRLVDGRSFFIGLDSGVVVASADVNVGRHVYDMSRTRRQSGKSVGSSQCSLGRTRTLNGVNVIVDSAHVIGVAFDHGFERGNDLVRARLGRAIWMPQAPGVKIHAR